MSKIISLVGAQNATNVQVVQRAAKLNFLFNCPDASAVDWATLLAKLNAVIVNISMQSPGGATEPMLQEMRLGDIAEIYSAIEGYIDVVDNGASFDTRFSMELSNQGALVFNNDTKIVINIRGMVANDNLDVYATDYPVSANKAIKTNTLRFSANAPQGVSCANASKLHLPVASFSQMELYYPNGSAVTLVKEELAEWALEGNGVMGVLAGVVRMGYLSYYSFDVSKALNVKVTQTADVNGFIFTEVPVL